MGEGDRARLYLDLAAAAALRDAGYWLQLMMAAGIATLGLVLDSTAVVIGAMLISPLMGAILAFGLGLASGDPVLGVRALAKLVLSCALALGCAALLVAVLPFHTVTSEIARRTEPNLLDLLVALLSGAVGAFGLVKQPTGPSTSLPGVAIAVALMPPLCVVGFGLGVGAHEGASIAAGGGLLLLTNLVAIAFSALLIFYWIHVDTPGVRRQVAAWQREDAESRWLAARFSRWPRLADLEALPTFRERFLPILLVLGLIAVPLSRSFVELKREVAARARAVHVEAAARAAWHGVLELQPDGSARSYLGEVQSRADGERERVVLEVFTRRAATADERILLHHELAARLDMPLEAVELELVEVPTTSGELEQLELPASRPPLRTLGEERGALWQRLETALASVELPPGAERLGLAVTLTASEPLRVRLTYLAETELSTDAQMLLRSAARHQLTDPGAALDLAWVPALAPTIECRRGSDALSEAARAALAEVSRQLAAWPALRARVAGGRLAGEPEALAASRAQAAAAVLTQGFGIDAGRLEVAPGPQLAAGVEVRLVLTGEPVDLPRTD